MKAPLTESTVNRSEQLFERAQKVLPGGVSRNTVFRLPHPIYAEYGSGCYVTDVDGIQRIDFSNNMASLIHGHAHPRIVEALTEQLARGTAFATATEAEVVFAELLCERVQSFQKIRFVNSGTEAVMVAIKAARAFTGKPKIAKVEGAYHGTYDYAEVSQTASPENWGEAHNPNSVPVVRGTPKGALSDVVIIPFNDTARAVEILDAQAQDIACILIDPLPHRVGFIPVANEYLESLYDWTRRHAALLVFDEVITFRTNYAGAQENYSEQPDLTAMGKMIGGGFPVGAIAGRDEVMGVLDARQKSIPFPHSGTFSANPMTMTAGRIAMEMFDREAVERLNRLGDFARQRIAHAIQESGAEACVTGTGSMFRVHLKRQPPQDYRSCYAGPKESQSIRQLVDYLYGAGFMLINTCSGTLSTPMAETEIEQLADAFRAGLRELKA